MVGPKLMVTSSLSSFDVAVEVVMAEDGLEAELQPEVWAMTIAQEEGRLYLGKAQTQKAVLLK